VVFAARAAPARERDHGLPQVINATVAQYEYGFATIE
jgi:hypothetical protein